ncbi:dynamin family protein [Salipaludibacillus sp. CF4.18]|uniref:dynamin family protein n=1 Tax=Salipaludibacillus sp. CF4.18 TaxID=3373081 RepID=UPI003EE45E5D
MKNLKNETLSFSEVEFTTAETYRYQRLADKKQSAMFEVAFCGHFSAGKSTLLNKMLQADILPTSPIPTSANIVRIQKGDLALKVHSQDSDDDHVFEGEIPWDKVRQWGMDGKSLSGMTITAPLPFLGDHGCIVDTPGVDSTDDSHEAVTVEQLYSTDAIVYVMDYNHVQSETNLSFLRQLSLEKKPIYLVVNQIDKHDEREISLDTFRTSVTKVLKEWDITFIELYFTSMKKMDHPANQFTELEKILKGLLFNSERLLDDSLKQLNHGFYQAIESRLLVEKQESLNEVYEKVEEDGFDSKDLDRQEELAQELVKLRDYDQVMRESYQKDMSSLFKNVTLFPYTTTELTKHWLEAMEPGFKMGFLFSKKKTEEEQDSRLMKLIDELEDKVKSQLLFHVQAYFQKVNREELLNKQAFEKAYEDLSIVLEMDWFKNQINRGHKSNDYVYTFTKDITTKIVKHIQSQSAALLEVWIKERKAYVTKQKEQLVGKLLSLENLDDYKKELNLNKTLYDNQLKGIQILKPEKQTSRDFEKKLIDVSVLTYPSESVQQFKGISLPTDSIINKEEEEVLETHENSFSEKEAAVWLDKLHEGLLASQDSKILTSERNQLLERIKRYKDQTFIISLFGAFSAGKSSFANALLGERVMPVSPNPTTATVTTVLAPTNDNSHGTAVIALKSKRALSDEINSVSSTLDLTLTADSIKTWKPDRKSFVTSWQKTNADYLSTIQTSLLEKKLPLGETLTVSNNELASYVADEQYACLIEQVHIYYDCNLTRQGIVLVDTPGVNSIHARHTNVAFKQLRQSDAIFYLTYYNHAFSKADHYFLQQMGKVNKSFGQDKLYFVINASDLAESIGELNGVKRHVRDQLKNNGIEQPRVYHLSSKEGMAQKEKKTIEETSFSRFEEAFYQQTILELKTLAIKMIEHQAEQFSEKLKDSISFMTSDRDVQIQKQTELKAIAAEEIERVQEQRFTVPTRDVLHELDQFTLYLRQRITYVLNDYYPMTINVSVLTGTSKKQLHQQLIGAIQEWRGHGEQFMKQEIEAISIRLENVIKRYVEAWLMEQKNNVSKRLPYFTMDSELKSVELKDNDQDISFTFDPLPYLTYLKSKKDFFENGKAKDLKEALVNDGTERAKEQISKAAEKFQESVNQSMDSLEKQMQSRLTETIQEESQRLDALLDRQEKQSLEQELTMIGTLIKSSS